MLRSHSSDLWSRLPSIGLGLVAILALYKGLKALWWPELPPFASTRFGSLKGFFAFAFGDRGPALLYLLLALAVGLLAVEAWRRAGKASD